MFLRNDDPDGVIFYSLSRTGGGGAFKSLINQLLKEHEEITFQWVIEKCIDGSWDPSIWLHGELI